MSTKSGTGYSKEREAEKAAEEATLMALKALGGKVPHLVVVFSSTTYDYKAVLTKVKAIAGTSQIVGCSTAGELTEHGPRTQSLVVMAIQSDTMVFELAKATHMKGSEDRVDQVLKDFESQIKEKTAQGYPFPTVMILSDGLMGSGEELVQAVYRKTGILCQLVGGAAGDDGKFQGTFVFHGEEVLSNAVVFVKIFSKKKVGIGVEHGMRSCTEPMHVTKSKGSVLYELDHKPAFQVYEEFAKKKGVVLNAENIGKFLIDNELAILAGHFTKIRAPLTANPDGSLNMATEVPQDYLVTIVDSAESELTGAATKAAQEALENLKGEKAGAILVFDCICRQTILGKNFFKEVQAIHSVFGPSTSVIGFATYGEIARFGGNLNGFHNSTAVVCALPD